MHHREYSYYRGFALAEGFTVTRDIHHTTSTIIGYPHYKPYSLQGIYVTRHLHHKIPISQYHNRGYTINREIPGREDNTVWEERGRRDNIVQVDRG